MKLIDLTGKKFGKLTPIKRIPRPSHIKGTSTWWLCKCDCGNLKEIRAGSLNNGETKSCGCITRKGNGEACLNSIFYNYKHHAKNKKIDFDLTKEYFENLLQQNCFYCGERPSRIIKSKFSTGDYIYNGIDRINNSLGYIKGNVVACCTTCNLAKRSMSKNEFFQWIKKVYKNISERYGI